MSSALRPGKQRSSIKGFTRREFIKASLLACGALTVSTGIQPVAWAAAASEAGTDNQDRWFQHGVASGDPLADCVIIWTRVTPVAPQERLTIIWEVASDAAFKELLHQGQTHTGAAQDFTVKVDVRNLKPATRYFYRFVCQGAVSPTGITRTLPTGSIAQAKLAVFSCANFPAGYFHAYGEAAKMDDLDAVLHLGDYLYEYGINSYNPKKVAALGRNLAADNERETLTLTDYRKRYALYRSDPDLQALHAAVPFIVVWDDHEIANDSWQTGALNHNRNEGDFAVRKQQALQAYFEWLPIRPLTSDDDYRIYRQFQFGDLLSLYMLDTRLIGRDRQLSYGGYINTEGVLDLSKFRKELHNPNRRLLGAEQANWLLNAMKTSTATWQVLGQQVLMGRMHIPVDMLGPLLKRNRAALLPKIQELLQLQQRAQATDPTLTEADKVRLQQKLPYQLGAWDGYPFERKLLLETVKALQKKLVVLAGDTHNAWASHLRSQDGDVVGVEFATASVSSPGMERYLRLKPSDIPLVEQGLVALIDDLEYVHLEHRGFMVVTFTQAEARSEWIFVDTVTSRDYVVLREKSARFRVEAGTGSGTANRLLEQLQENPTKLNG